MGGDYVPETIQVVASINMVADTLSLRSAVVVNKKISEHGAEEFQVGRVIFPYNASQVILTYHLQSGFSLIEFQQAFLVLAMEGEPISLAPVKKSCEQAYH